MLEVGSKFIQAWIGCKNPISFEVLEINREKNSLKVECTNTEGHKWIEDWDDLNITEVSFLIGDYRMI
jgi:hypothetical protein